MPSATYNEPDKYADKYRMPGSLESYADKKAKEKEEKVSAMPYGPYDMIHIIKTSYVIWKKIFIIGYKIGNTYKNL